MLKWWLTYLLWNGLFIKSSSTSLDSDVINYKYLQITAARGEVADAMIINSVAKLFYC